MRTSLPGEFFDVAPVAISAVENAGREPLHYIATQLPQLKRQGRAQGETCRFLGEGQDRVIRDTVRLANVVVGQVTNVKRQVPGRRYYWWFDGGSVIVRSLKAT